MALRDQIIFALDVASPEAATPWINLLGGQIGWFKLGLELFTAAGPRMLEEIKKAGIRCFLDLKLHDIPNTVAGAVRSATRLQADMLTIHLSGGMAMARAAADAARDEAAKLGIKPPLIVGVSVLTSLAESDFVDLGWTGAIRDQIERLMGLAIRSGLDGMVCSAADLGFVQPLKPQGFTIVTPGIRPAGADIGDQARIATPGGAIQSGADLLVIGRPISQAADPKAAIEQIIKEMETV